MPTASSPAGGSRAGGSPAGGGDLAVLGGDVLVDGGVRPGSDVIVRGGRIAEIGPVLDVPPGLPTLAAKGLVVAPGFVELQCNGAGGIDLTAEPERLWEVAALLPRWGVTAWLPTIVTSPEANRRRALAAFARGAPGPGGTANHVVPNDSAGPGGPADPAVLDDFAGPHDFVDPDGAPVATPLGLHLEGPFLSPERKGAHVARHLALPELAAIEGWSLDAGVRLVTLAPELPGALEVMRALVDRGVVVSLGHSMATAAEASAGVDAGARWATHLFNAMPPLHHRDPGLAGVALTDERLGVGLIADGVHVHPLMVLLAARALGPRLTLVTDAVAALGMPPGVVRLGGMEALSDGEGVRLSDGTLAGSNLSMDDAVANLMAFAGSTLVDAVDAATRAPAAVLGVDHERGVLAPGAVGDLVLLEPGGVGVVATVIGGRVAWRS